jgi:hypothetical protein
MGETLIIALISMASSSVGGLLVWLRTRKRDGYEETKLMQEVYRNMFSDMQKSTDDKIGQLKEEIHMMRVTLEQVYGNCEVESCKNYPLKKSHIKN